MQYTVVRVLAESDSLEDAKRIADAAGRLPWGKPVAVLLGSPAMTVYERDGVRVSLEPGAAGYDAPAGAGDDVEAFRG